MNECTIVILGATGDLAKRKLIPALYTLIKSKKLKNFALVGAALEDVSSKDMINAARKFIKDIDEDIWTCLQKHSFYQKLNFNEEKDFDRLYSIVNSAEREYGLSGNRLVYCAVSSDFFCEITEALCSSKIIKACTKNLIPWNRIVYEKPFGRDLKSAHMINECIAKLLYEHQIYRVDHYLTKELVSNIALLRFTNCIFEPLWNNRYIDHVQIILSEKIGLEGRGYFYDKYGAIADVMQNHMFELLALVAMEMPKWLTGEYIRQERAAVLKNVRAVDICRGQFEGYLEDPGVGSDSATETFALASLMVDNPRWTGVPFYLKTGKCLKQKKTVIYIKFKKINCLLTQGCPLISNYLTMEIAPEARFYLTLNVKKPGSLYDAVPVNMEFCHDALSEEKIAESYEILLEEVIRGEQSISVRFDEIEYSWNVIDQLNKLNSKLYTYKKGSDGPKECEEFEHKYGMRWQL